jgi:hypothetical protein
MRRLLKPLWVLLALLFLLEAWLWERLAVLVGRIVDLVPWRALKARLAGWIENLPPAATLVVFVVPLAVLFPIKIAGLWLLAHGHWLAALGALILAKLVGLGVTAFVFDLTRPKLLQLAWFRWLYAHALALRAWAQQMVAPVQERMRAWLRRLRRRSGLLRRLASLRRRMQRA